MGRQNLWRQAPWSTTHPPQASHTTESTGLWGTPSLGRWYCFSGQWQWRLGAFCYLNDSPSDCCRPCLACIWNHRTASYVAIVEVIFFSSAFKILLILKLLACLRHSVSKCSATENGAITEMKRKRERDLGQVGLRRERKSLSPVFFRSAATILPFSTALYFTNWTLKMDNEDSVVLVH